MVMSFPLRGPPTRPPDCERALALMEEARDLLEGLWERGEISDGSPPAETVFYLDNAIGMLRPFEDDEVAHG